MKDLIYFCRFFYALKGPLVIWVALLLLLAGWLEVFSMSLFLPILEGETSSQYGQMIQSIFSSVGVEYCLGNVLLAMLFLLGASSVLMILKTAYIGHISSRLLVDLREQVMEDLFGSDYQYCVMKDAGYINNAVTIELQQLAFSFEMFAGVLTALVFALSYLIVPVTAAPGMSAVAAVMGLPFIFFIRWINLKTKYYSVKRAASAAMLQDFMIQILHHLKYLKATSAQSKILSKLYGASRMLGKLQFRQALLSGVTKSGFAPLVLMIICLILYYQVEVVGRELASVAFILFMLKRAGDRVLSAQQSYRKFLQSVGGIQVYQKFEKELKAHQEPVLSNGGVAPDWTAPFVFDQVSFRYALDKPKVLSQVSLVIKPFTTVAFVGESGSGKSTLAALLTGLLRPQSGSLCMGDVPVAKLNTPMLRAGIGYVTQESVMFNDTIGANISLFDPEEEGRTDRVIAACQQSHISEFIESQPNRYETMLGNNGINISGGQRQRISIARELYKNAQILIFDEATSALDSASERAIQNNIDEFRGSKTIVLIAHRLSTVRNVDCIYVLSKGAVVESGTYDHLVELNGEFSRMVSLQQEKEA